MRHASRTRKHTQTHPHARTHARTHTQEKTEARLGLGLAPAAARARPAGGAAPERAASGQAMTGAAQSTITCGQECREAGWRTCGRAGKPCGCFGCT